MWWVLNVKGALVPSGITFDWNQCPLGIFSNNDMLFVDRVNYNS